MPINIYKSSIADYFDTNIHNGDVAYKDFVDEVGNEVLPKCSYRFYNISEIINSMIKRGFTIREFNEDPSWTNEKLPGEITVYGVKQRR